MKNCNKFRNVGITNLGILIVTFLITATSVLASEECGKSDSVHAQSLEGIWELDRDLFARNFEGTGTAIDYLNAEFIPDEEAQKLFAGVKPLEGKCIRTAGRMKLNFKVKWASDVQEKEGEILSPYVVIEHRGNMVIIYEERGKDAYALVEDAQPSITDIMRGPKRERDILMLGGDHASEASIPLKRLK